MQPRLVLVSKLKPPSDILAAHEATGHAHFGENYIQELVDKAEQVCCIRSAGFETLMRLWVAPANYPVAFHRCIAKQQMQEPSR